MIRHIVMWEFPDEVDGRSRADIVAEVRDRLAACAGLVEGMGTFRVVVPQEGLEASFDLLLDSEFASEAALQAYANHPTHRAVGDLIAATRTARHAFDYDPDLT